MALTLDPQDIRRMQNVAAGSRVDGAADQATVSEFVAMVKQTPREKQVKIADTLIGRVSSRQPMQHGGKTLTLATMAAIVVALA